MPNASAARARRRIARTWLRMNSAAMPNNSSALPATQVTKIQIGPTSSRLRGAATSSTPSGSWMWIATVCGSDTQSTSNGRPIWCNAAARSSSIGPSTLVEPRVSRRACGRMVMPSWNWVAALCSSQSRSALRWVRSSSSRVSVISPLTAPDSRRDTTSRWLP